MKDSRLGQIRSLAAEAASIAAELCDEIDPDSYEETVLLNICYDMRHTLTRTDELEALP